MLEDFLSRHTLSFTAEDIYTAVEIARNFADAMHLVSHKRVEVIFPLSELRIFLDTYVDAGNWIKTSNRTFACGDINNFLIENPVSTRLAFYEYPRILTAL